MRKSKRLAYFLVLFSLSAFAAKANVPNLEMGEYHLTKGDADLCAGKAFNPLLVKRNEREILVVAEKFPFYLAEFSGTKLFAGDPECVHYKHTKKVSSSETILERVITDSCKDKEKKVQTDRLRITHNLLEIQIQNEQAGEKLPPLNCTYSK